MSRFFLFLVAVCIVTVGSFVMHRKDKPENPSGTNGTVESSQTSPSGPQPDRSAPAVTTPNYDIDSPGSLTAVINKTRPLPQDYRADDLYTPDVPLRQAAGTENMQVRRVMEADINKLFAAAAAAGLQLEIGSAYRSAATQSTLYNGYVASSGQAYADLTSARPGFSEHQSGLAVDFNRTDGQCFLEKCFADTAEGTWLAANAGTYGFVLRYPLEKTPVTGYDFEPWHYRYVGLPIAGEIAASGLTLEEFFKTGPAPDYR